MYYVCMLHTLLNRGSGPAGNGIKMREEGIQEKVGGGGIRIQVGISLKGTVRTKVIS